MNTHPACSPDGNWIAFTGIRGGQSDIFLVHPDGGGEVRLTDDPTDNADAAFSPESRQIAFVSQRDGRGSIYIMKLDGTILKSLTDFPGSISSPAWSPDGSKIAFYSYREGYVSGIFRTPTDGSGQIGMQIALVPRTLESSNPCWLPASYAAVGQQGEAGSTEKLSGTLIPFVDDPTGLVNIRLGPSADYELAGRLPGGTQVVALGRTEAGDWIQIEYPQGSGQTAWVYYTLIQLDYGNLPVVIHSTPTPG